MVIAEAANAVQAVGITWDLSINVGNILTIFTFIGGGIWFILTMRNKVDFLASRNADLERDLTQMAAETQNEVRKLTEVIILQSRHDERITALTQTVVNQGKRLDDTTRRMNTYLDMKFIAAVDEVEK